MPSTASAATASTDLCLTRRARQLASATPWELRPQRSICQLPDHARHRPTGQRHLDRQRGWAVLEAQLLHGPGRPDVPVDQAARASAGAAQLPELHVVHRPQRDGHRRPLWPAYGGGHIECRWRGGPFAFLPPSNILPPGPFQNVSLTSQWMYNTWSSINDPIFFMHHANVDRMWALWQRSEAVDSARRCFGLHVSQSNRGAHHAQHSFGHGPVPGSGSADPVCRGYFERQRPRNFVLQIRNLRSALRVIIQDL